MLRKEMTKVEIEKELSGKGDYVLIDNMTRFLKENPPLDIKKFVSLKLVEIYEKRAMFGDAAELYSRLVEIALNNSDKVNYLTKQTECYVRAGFFDKADLALKRAVAEASIAERAKITMSIKEFYKKQAQMYEKEKRRNNAMKTYEKMLTMNFSEAEKMEINQKLAGIYKELGLVERYMSTERKL
ncbi:Uncharacterised protein [uncultured archaeon]|nr:Uncharacterised protein [uncultured archaeon]